MTSSFTVFVVDDDPAILESMSAILDTECQVETFETCEACLGRLSEAKPDMLLLDVNLPGMNGYTLCRRMKDDAATAPIPVTFVSGSDTTEARLLGYDAGGEDFVVKPFDPEELLRKIRVAQQIARERRLLLEQVEAAEYLSSLALAGMDEGGIALQFMSELIAYENEQDVAEGLLALMKRYRLDGAVQIRLGQRKLTLSAAGANLPLESSVLDLVQGMGRIFEFRSQGVHNFERVSLLIRNLPLDDPDYCGRLRDNLSIAAQGADSRLRAIDIEAANERSRKVVMDVMANTMAAIEELRRAYKQDKDGAAALMFQLEESMIDSFVHLGLTDTQEQFLSGLVTDFMQRMVQQFDRGEDTFRVLTNLSEQLAQLR